MTLLAIWLSVWAVMAVGMAITWAYQRAVQNGGWTDVFWTFGTGACGVACALLPVAGLPWPTPRQAMVAALVAAWSIRLGLYMLVRVARSPEDQRYTRFRLEWGEGFQRRMFAFLQTQAPATAALCLAIRLAADNPAPGLRAQDLIGAAILIVAVLGEGLADAQMRRFKADPARHGQVCQTGLWAWSRHPNYFFEWFGWLAYPVIAIGLDRPWSWLALIAPLAMGHFLINVTGVPLLEQAMIRSKGQAYRDYQARVSAFVPLPPRHPASVA